MGKTKGIGNICYVEIDGTVVGAATQFRRTSKNNLLDAGDLAATKEQRDYGLDDVSFSISALHTDDDAAQSALVTAQANHQTVTAHGVFGGRTFSDVVCIETIDLQAQKGQYATYEATLQGSGA
jgi:hypothetical protein